MKAISVALEQHLAQPQTTMATCWRVQLVNGTVYGFTSFDRNLVVNGVTYRADSGFAASAIASNGNLAADNLEMTGLLKSTSITEADLQAGLWDFAAIEVFQVNWADLSQGTMKMRRGTLGEVKVTRQQFMAELRGLAQQVQQTIGQIYSPSCRADFGDARCTVALGPLTVTGTITSVTDGRTFTDSTRAQATGFFNAGLFTFTSGGNAGRSMEIASFTSGGLFVLELPMAFTISIGDTYSARPGCGKSFTADCKTRYNNVVNFRGEPHVPGVDAMMRVGGS